MNCANSPCCDFVYSAGGGIEEEISEGCSERGTVITYSFIRLIHNLECNKYFQYIQLLAFLKTRYQGSAGYPVLRFKMYHYDNSHITFISSRGSLFQIAAYLLNRALQPHTNIKNNFQVSETYMLAIKI